MEISKNSRILITGGNGFLGSHVVDRFRVEGYSDIITFTSKEYNLTKEDEVDKLFNYYPDIDVVIHIAADIGGIGYSSQHPAKQFYNNTLINTFILHYAYHNKVKKFVGIGSVCEYPADTPIPFTEDQIWNGYPVDTNDAYGLTKRMLLGQSIAYSKEYGFNSIHLLLINLFGPKDNFDLSNSHVIPALIKKFHEAKIQNRKIVEVWGSGDVSREFLFVTDAAESILFATEKYNKTEPINIGSGEEIKIKDLSLMIADIVGYNGKIYFNSEKPSGQIRRQLDVSKAKKEINFLAKVKFIEGLELTYNYYINHIIIK